MDFVWITGMVLIFHAALVIILGRIPRKKPELKHKPFVSIIIPSYQNEKTIKETIISAKSLTYRKKEIIVVNDSKDKTPEICKSLGIYCIQNQKKLGKARAMNLALKHTKSEFLIFLDADALIEKNALEKMLPWFEKQDVAVVFPKFVTRNKKTLISKLTNLENLYHSAFFRMHMFFGSALSFRGCCCMIRRKALEKLGGWPEELTEDFALAMKIQKGYKIVYEPETKVSILEPETLKELKPQKTRWGRGAARVLKKQKPPKTPQFFIHFLPYVISLFLSLFTLFFNPFLLLIFWFIHFYMIFLSEKEINPMLIFLFTTFYAPLVSTIYIRARRHGSLCQRWKTKEPSPFGAP